MNDYQRQRQQRYLKEHDDDDLYGYRVLLDVRATEFEFDVLAVHLEKSKL